MARARTIHPSIGFVSTWPIYQGTTIDRHAHALIEGICAAARDRACRLVIGAGMSPVSERSRWRTVWPIPAPDIDFVPVGPWNMDGLIIVSDDLTDVQARHVREMQASGIPVVFTTPEGPGPRVVVDNKSGIRAAVDHLLGHGHRQIAFVAGTRHQAGDSAERLRTFRDALRGAGIEADERLIEWGDHRFVGGQAAMERIIRSGRPFSAFIASNDLSCLGAIQALRTAGRSVPRDVAAIGFDDILDARSSTPPLTTVRHPTFAQGYQAVMEVLEQIATPRPDGPAVVVPTRLIRRQSCGCSTTVEASPPERPADEGLAALPRRMADAAFVEARRSNVDQLEVQCRALVDALVGSLDSGDAGPLREELARQLAETETRGEDAHVWHAAISLLYARSELLLSRAPAVAPTWFRGLLDEARLAISENVGRRTTHALLSHVDMMSELGLLTAQLIAAHDVEETRDILAEMLPRLGIGHFMAVLFAGTEEDPVSVAEVLMSGGLSGEPIERFPSRRFPPDAFYPADDPLQLVVLPLDVDVGTSGFVALPTSGLEPAAAIVSNLATAIRASRLYDEAVEGRRLAEEASRLKSRFLSMVSHELRTPLSIVVGLSDIVLRDSRHHGALAAATVQDLERLSINARHLGRLIGDVLDLASSEAGQLRLERESLDLTALMSGLGAVGEAMAGEKGLGWRMQLPPTSCPVVGDRTRLRQVVLNLISNAVRYTDAGEVTVALEIDGPEALVTVTDTGQGIAPEDHARVFEEFYRSRSGRAGAAGSLGLGLAITRQLVEHHGGTVSVRSPGANGQGSIFVVRLPLADAAPPAEAPPSAPAVLVLSDQPLDDSPLVSELRSRGLRVRVAEAHEEADPLQPIQAERTDAVVLAGTLGARLGWKVVRALKSTPGLEKLPVVACRVGEDQAVGALELNYLLKPLGVDDFARTLTEARVATGSGDTPTILVVDDDADMRRLHVRVVEQAGGRALEAGDGFEALAVMERNLPDLVLLDLAMPDMDGYEVLEAMRSRAGLRDVPVVVVTMQTLTDDDLARLNRGVATILSKGIFTTSETVSRIEAALTRRGTLGTATQQLIHRATAFIHEHYAEPITRDDIAGHVALSPDYLTDCFHKEHGITPIAYLNRCRINEAKALLDETDLSVTEIALRVGFSDASHFTRTFHREAGVSPRAYRRGQRIEPGIEQELPVR